MRQTNSPIQINDPRGNHPGLILFLVAGLCLFFFVSYLYYANGQDETSVQEPEAGPVEQKTAPLTGDPTAAIFPDKMNVFYIGVENPISISAPGVSSNDLMVSVSGGGGRIRMDGTSRYTIVVSTPEECRVNVSGGGVNSSRIFRVKRIPDPVARLSKYTGGAIGSGEFKAQGGVAAFLDDFDFDANCVIQGYRLTYLAPQQEPAVVINAGARYNAESRRLINMAESGDIYTFDNVKARCPGDTAGRLINSMAFKIQ